jgi:UDP-N-acetylmuramoylalanine--D-glutamate ligase
MKLQQKKQRNLQKKFLRKNKLTMKISELKDKKIAILWFWKEGQSTLRFLQKEGISDITILDKNEVHPSSFSIKGGQGESQCERRQPGLDSEVDYIYWDSYLDTLWEFDLIFKSPGVSPFQEKLLPYREKFISQTEIFFENYSGKVIGLTGTKGKSTCSTLLYTCLQQAGFKVKLVGNIGSPVLDEISLQPSSFSIKGGDSEVDYEMYDYVIYELSSYMLQDFSPKLEIGFLNNIYPCHLDWHYNSFTIYKEAKTNILKNASVKIIWWELKNDTQILDIPGEKIFFGPSSHYHYDEAGYKIGEKYIYQGNQKLLWEHNVKNICWIIAVLENIIQDQEKVSQTLQSVLPEFIGLPHRIENIGKYEDITFINDAIATTPESTIAAIDTFWDDLQTLFLWGEDSGFQFASLRRKILDTQIQNIIAFPDTSEKIFPEIEPRDYEKAFEIEIEGKLLQFIKTRSMKSGVDFAFRTTFPWKIALLSCAAPSFSLWKNYLAKAEEFQREVQKY